MSDGRLVWGRRDDAHPLRGCGDVFIIWGLKAIADLLLSLWLSNRRNLPIRRRTNISAEAASTGPFRPQLRGRRRRCQDVIRDPTSFFRRTYPSTTTK